MLLSSLPTPLALGPDKLPLGTLVQDICDPLDGPLLPQPNDSISRRIITSDFTFSGQVKDGRTISSSLKMFLEARFSRQGQVDVAVDSASGHMYMLGDASLWFDNLVAQERTRRWIEERALSNKKFFLIVGLKTLVNPSIATATGKGRTLGGEADLSAVVAAAGGGLVGLVGNQGPSLSAARESSRTVETKQALPGERICSIDYRVIKTKWFSSKAAQPFDVSKTRSWSCLEGKLREAGNVSDDEGDDSEEDVDNTVEEDSIMVELLELASGGARGL